ncbi:hypothetical protein BGZ46_003952 [Entomortierella lignicola]|nr:hypothetical protein BGZ46_003952 [Entomortierella lignicola]
MLPKRKTDIQKVTNAETSIARSNSKKASPGPSTTTKPSTSAREEPTGLVIHCMVENETTSFPVPILSNVLASQLKEATQPKRPSLKDIYASGLVLKLIPGGATKAGVGKLNINSLKELDNELEKLEIYFPNGASYDRIDILIELPQQGMSHIW